MFKIYLLIIYYNFNFILEFRACNSKSIEIMSRVVRVVILLYTRFSCTSDVCIIRV